MAINGCAWQWKRRSRWAAPDTAAVRHLVEAEELTHRRDAFIELGALARFERPLPAITDYDGLLSLEAVS